MCPAPWRRGWPGEAFSITGEKRLYEKPSQETVGSVSRGRVENTGTMKILAIGLGGAGCRIVDALTSQAQRHPTQDYLLALCVDSDSMCLDALHHVPVERRYLIAPLGAGSAAEPAGVFAEEVTAKVHAADPGDIDAIILFGGLGGHMMASAPELIKSLTSEFFESVFCFCTLPTPEEGPAVSARAVRQVDRIMPLCEGIILSDNATLMENIPHEPGKRDPISSFPGISRITRRRSPPVPEPGAEYSTVNTAITRRILLLLRAGEYHERPGGEIAETVLDAGEILNTIRGGGVIAIGYASEKLRPRTILDKVSPLRIRRHQISDPHERASRLVDLGLEAATNGMSIRCRMDSVARALVLVAGPSRELSMKGYLLVRWWLDQAIRGGDVRAGDYPIPGSRSVGLILILAGVEEVPRLAEIRQFGESGVLTPQE